LGRVGRGLALLSIVFNLFAPWLALDVVEAAPAAPTAASSTATSTTATTADSGPKVRLLVKFKASASSADVDAAVQAADGTKTRSISQLRTPVIEVPASAKDRVLAALAKNGQVERATATVKLKKATEPNDPGYAQQWSLPKIAWDQD
jgi:hypothetical protein